MSWRLRSGEVAESHGQSRTLPTRHRQGRRLLVVLARPASSQMQAEAVRWQANLGPSSELSLRSHGSPPASRHWNSKCGAFRGPAGVVPGCLLDSKSALSHASTLATVPCCQAEVKLLLNTTVVVQCLPSTLVTQGAGHDSEASQGQLPGQGGETAREDYCRWCQDPQDCVHRLCQVTLC